MHIQGCNRFKDSGVAMPIFYNNQIYHKQRNTVFKLYNRQGHSHEDDKIQSNENLKKMQFAHFFFYSYVC